MNTQLALIDGIEADFTAIASRENHVNWASEKGFIVQALEADWKLKKATDISLRNAILNIATTGISISPLLGLAHLECRGINTEPDKRKDPVYRNDAALKIDYKGQIKVLTDSGAVNWIRADVVRSGDTFNYHGPASKPDHIVGDPFSADRRAIVGSYAIAELPSGQILCEIMRLEELEEVEKASGTTSGPWKNGFKPEMYKKANINRIVKTIPRTNERSAAVIRIAAESDGFEFDQTEVVKPQSFTEDQLKDFNKAIKEKDGFALIDMAVDKDVWISLFNSFEAGKVTSTKTIVRSLMAGARKVIEASHVELVKLMNAEDTHGAIEILEETPLRFITPHADEALNAWLDTLETSND